MDSGTAAVSVHTRDFACQRTSVGLATGTVVRAVCTGHALSGQCDQRVAGLGGLDDEGHGELLDADDSRKLSAKARLSLALGESGSSS